MRKHTYEHVLSFALEHPWSLTTPMMGVVAGILARRLAGVDSEAEIEHLALVNRKSLPQPKVGSVGIIPVYGVIAPRMNMLTEMSGGTTYEKLGQQLNEALHGPSIKTIVLDIDSPGGSVAGNAEFAAQLLGARTRKPIIAVAQYTCASAAYHLASCCTSVYAAPSALVGSIGTYLMHDDISAALDTMGIKRTFISAGGGKLVGNPAVPLDDASTVRMKAMVDGAYQQFVDNVVRGRGAGTTAATVKNEWQAHLYSATDALALGMVDKVATLEETLTRLLATSPDAADRAAAANLTAGDTDQELPLAAATSQDHRSRASLQRLLLELEL